jgi:tryptophan synthase beta chain
MDEARACKETGESRAILFGLSGHGLLDLTAYQDYLHGNLIDG